MNVVNNLMSKDVLKLRKFFSGLMLYGGSFKVVCVILLGCVVLSFIIPPFQSPDEHSHISRAYLLGKGVLILDRPAGHSSGGYLDSHLSEFMGSYGYGVIKGKLMPEQISSASAIQWGGQQVYRDLPGTGYYFPAIYLPQAIGLQVGELLDLTINHSFRLARVCALVVTALLLYAAFRIYPPNPLALALIALPMTLYQFSSASIDGVSTALTILAISAFLRIATNKDKASRWIQYTFALAIAILASCRFHASPLLLLLAASFFYTKQRRSLLLFVAVTLFVLGWTLFAFKTTVDLRIPIGDSPFNIALFYVTNPAQFFAVVWRTLSNDVLQAFYWKSFLGILGPLDFPFKNWQYVLLTLILSIIVFLTVSFQHISKEWTQRLLLLMTCMISMLLIFFALLVTWSPHPAQIIDGIQGRYFLIPAIILAYSLSGNASIHNHLRANVATFAVFLLFFFSFLATVDLIIHQYY